MSDNRPAKKFRLGFVTATVWKNEGVENPFYTVNFQRSWKDDDGNWKNGDGFNAADLPVIERLAARAEAWIAEQ
jgi:hypothetical protein